MRAWGRAVLGTFSRAAVRPVCPCLPGLRHPVAVAAWHLSLCRGCGRRRASLACLVALHCCAAPRPVRSLSVLPSAFRSPWCLPHAGRLRGAPGGRPRTGLIVPAAGPCQAMGAGLALRHTHSGPRDGVVPGGSLRLRSLAACATVVWRVWTRSLMRLVSRTVRLSTGDSASAPGLFRVDAGTSPFGSEDNTPGSRACMLVRALLAQVGQAGLPRGFWCASAFLWLFCPSALSGPLQAGVARASVVRLVFFFRFHARSFPFLPTSRLAPPLSPAFCALRPWPPWALALFVCSYPPPRPPPLFFCLCLFLPLSSHLPSRAPAVSGFSCFPALGALGLGALRLLVPPLP